MNFGGLDLNKLLVIGLIAVVLVGPERLPHYAEVLARFVKRAGEFLRGAKDRVAEEMGPEFKETDWRKLDPRQYDPRRIIRDAILEPEAPAPRATNPVTAAAAAAGLTATVAAQATVVTKLAPSEVPPYDEEAT